MLQLKYLAAALLLAAAASGGEPEDTCAAPAPWEAALEDWATAERGNLTRHGRIMSLAPSQGYYVTDRVDLVPPPPPRPRPSPGLLHRGPYPMPQKGHHSGPPHSSAGGNPYGPPTQPQTSGNYEYNHIPSGSSQQPGTTHQQTGNPNQQPNSSQPPQASASGPVQGSGSSNYNSGPPQGFGSSNYNPGPPQGSGSSNYNPGPPQGSGSSNYNPGPPQGSGSSNYIPAGAATPGPPGPQGSMPYDEWQATPPPPPGAGKIVNRPPNPYKDQFKPSYPAPPHPIPVSADRVDEPAPAPPQKQVSETDLYLLRAIEKLVYRVDLMEKRMRKMEENVHYIVAGADVKPEPCETNYTRVGARCYHFSSEAVNWKSASYACRKLKANLLELDADERKQFISGVQANKKHNGSDFWTGGLNPGLLWIWSHSATAVAANGTDAGSAAIAGDGRCLALVAAPATRDYVYRGQDCALRHRYVCEKDEDKTKLSNEIERVARSMRERDLRRPKMPAWDADKL